MGTPGTADTEVEFSVLVSCYFEEQSIDEFYSRLSATMESLGRSYELIFVNDGSTDRTFEKLKAIFDQDPNVTTVVDFFKNVGQANAKTPEVMLARGKAIVLIDSDLQLDPEELPMLVEKYDEGFDIVSGYRKNRSDSLLRKLPSVLANVIMRSSSGAALRDFGCTFKIYNSRLVRALDFGPFRPWRPLPVIALAGRIAEVPVSHHPRKFGQSGWTFAKLFAYNMENLVTLSQRPFQLLGGLCLFLAAVFALRIITAFFIPFQVIPTVTTGLLLNFLLAGLLITLFVLAVVGEFVIRTFVRLERTPAFVVREIHDKLGRSL